MNKKGKSSSKVTKKSLKRQGNGLKNRPMDLNKIQKILGTITVQQQKTAQQMKKMAQQVRENYRKIQENAQEIQKTTFQVQETESKYKEYFGDVESEWGPLGDNLLTGGLAKALKKRGIQIDRVIPRLRNDYAEFSIVAINEKEIVIVEVRSKLDFSNVDGFEKDIKNFKVWWDFAGEKNIYGAISFFEKSNKKVRKMAEERGFFVISAINDVVIENTKEFRPRDFS